jgi:hypothetical protein
MNKTMSALPVKTINPTCPASRKSLYRKNLSVPLLALVGKIIQEMQRETNTVIVLEEVGDLA